METKKHRITFTLTEDAQRQAAKKGQDAAKHQSYDLPQELIAQAIDLGASIDAQGNVTLDVSAIATTAFDATAGDARHSRSLVNACPTSVWILDTRPEDAAAALAAAHSSVAQARVAATKVVAEKRDEARTSIEQYLASSVTADEHGVGDSTVKWAADPALTRRVQDRRALREQARAERLAEHTRAVEAFEAGNAADPGLPHFAPSSLDARVHDERARRAAAQKAEQQRQLQSWIADHGTESQRERFAESVLPEDELKQALRDHLFATLDEIPRYERLTKSDVYAACHDDDVCIEGNPCEFRAADTSELSEAEYEALKCVRALAPQGATVIARIHSGGFETESEWRIHRLAALVTVEFCGYTLSREYSLES